ncbi:uncharacterized protein IWZ02DRAFT_281696 [Phyllosticta citriasiana]|uniref:Uncharacterized protein n=1 Tax=Phyllosticta citriasiana TaxID=595635 RepID=A0ABR1KYI2_9PEZI
MIHVALLPSYAMCVGVSFIPRLHVANVRRYGSCYLSITTTTLKTTSPIPSISLPFSNLHTLLFTFTFPFPSPTTTAATAAAAAAAPFISFISPCWLACLLNYASSIPYPSKHTVLHCTAMSCVGGLGRQRHYMEPHPPALAPCCPEHAQLVSDADYHLLLHACVHVCVPRAERQTCLALAYLVLDAKTRVDVIYPYLYCSIDI